MAREYARKHDRHGMTLVELLMVIGIMTLLLAVSIPMIRPAFQDRYMREAARQVNAFSLAGAKHGRPSWDDRWRVWIERVDATELGSRHATRLYLAEVAASFTGASLGFPSDRHADRIGGDAEPAGRRRHDPPYDHCAGREIHDQVRPQGVRLFWAAPGGGSFRDSDSAGSAGRSRRSGAGIDV